MTEGQRQMLPSFRHLRAFFLRDRNAALLLHQKSLTRILRGHGCRLQLIAFHDGFRQLDLQNRAIHFRRQNTHQTGAAAIGGERGQIGGSRHPFTAGNAKQGTVSPLVGSLLSHRNATEIAIFQNQDPVCLLSHDFLPPTKGVPGLRLPWRASLCC